MFTASGARPVTVATQIVGQEGVGLMNGVERFAGAVWEMDCPDPDLPPVWGGAAAEAGLRIGGTRFQLVMVDGADRYRPHGPRWSVITHEQLQNLVGATVAKGRGAGYRPHAAPPTRWRRR